MILIIRINQYLPREVPSICTLDAIIMANVKRHTEKYRIQKQLEQVRNRSKGTGNLKVLTRQKLIDIASGPWNNVDQKVLVRAFKLTGTYGATHPEFLSHQSKLKFIIK
jgi:hypothetical protein